MRSTSALVFAAAGLFRASALESEASMNPIRRVVNLLQQMQTKVAEEGEKEKQLYDKFMCWCRTGAQDLDTSISTADAKITSLGSDIEEASQKKAKAEEDLKQHQSDRDDAIRTMAEATGIREKEAATYAAFKAEFGANAAAMDKAIKALEEGMAGAFLQTHAADVLRKLAGTSRDDGDRETLLAFLSAKDQSEYAPQSGQIVGILKQMSDEMAAGYADATATEEAAIKAYEELMAAKKNEKALHSEAIETKTARIGALGVSIAEMKNDKGDTEEAMAADGKFKAELQKSCATKTAEWEERSKTRADELVALAETIKVLNDDDALELFKRTINTPASSLVQVKVSERKMRALAIGSLQSGLRKAVAGDRPKLDLIALALRGKKIGFEKVIAMIEKMVETLKREQADDDHKKEYCESSLDSTDDKKKGLERKVSDHEADMASAQESIATLTEEIAALTASIKALDKDVAEATENRKAEHKEFNDLIASNSAAKEVLQFAKNRLNKFYNPKMYKAPPKRELSAEERIFVNNGGEESATPAPGGIAGTGITYLQQSAPAFVQVAAHRAASDIAPPPAPETWDAYAKKGQESNGVMAMLDLLVADLDKEIQQMTVEESEAQKEYEAFMEDSKNKRAADSKSIADKEGHKADLEVQLQKDGVEHKETLKAGMEKAEQIRDLHLECDWLTSNHEARKEARTGEIESLKNAKAILSGADYALVQSRVSITRRLRGGA